MYGRRNYRGRWGAFRARDESGDAIRSKFDLKFGIAMLFMVVTIILMILPIFENAPPGVANWPPGVVLRVEARRDFNLQGGPMQDGRCTTVNGEDIGKREHMGINGVKPQYRDLYRNRPYECSEADHDLYALYVDPDGNEYEVHSHSTTRDGDGAFNNTTPSHVKGAAYGKRQDDPLYVRGKAVPNGAFRIEELTYRHRYLKPGKYYINVHLQRADKYLPEDDVLVGVFVVLFEGTPDEVVVFSDRVPVNARNREGREQTVVSFVVDEEGQLVEESLDYETQVFVAEG